MKTFLIPVAALSLLLLFGCESTINEPNEISNTKFVGALQENPNTYKDAVTSFPGVIRLDDGIFDPLNPSYKVRIEGVVRYNIERVANIDATALSVTIYINAKLFTSRPNQDQPQPWTIYGLTTDVLNSGTGFLEKVYEVRNTGDYCYKLFLRYKVTQRNVYVVSMELKSFLRTHEDSAF
jgi:hypothetical protein